MSELLDIIISAVDQASSVFESVSSSADEMANNLSSATTNGASDFEDIETAVESASSSIDSMDNAINSVDGTSISEAADITSMFEQEVSSADSQVQQLDADLGIINSSMLLQLSDQVGQLGSNAEGMAQDMNAAAVTVEQLSIQSGIARPQLEDMINTITNAAFPHEDAMLYIKSLDQIGVSAGNLAQSATDLDMINDAFGLGAEKTNSLGQELSVLGVDMNDVSSSFNALAYANANTVGGMENYYSFIRKYDSQFKELGLNVDQASVLIAGATHKFGGGRAALTGLSDALKDSNGDLRALEEALDLAPGSLENASDLTGEYAGQLEDMASSEEEHTTLLQQLGDAWEDLSLKISPVIGPLASAAGLIGQVGQFGLQLGGLKELGGIIKDIAVKMGILTVAEEANTVAEEANILAKEAETLAAEEATVANETLAVAEGLSLWWILAIVAAIAILVGIVYEVGKAFGWWDDVGGMLDAIWDGITRLWEAFINHPDVQAAIEMISNALSTLWSWITQAGQAILEFFGVSTSGDFDIIAAIIETIGGLWDNFKTIIMTVSDAVMSVYNAIAWAFGMIWNIIGPIVMMIVGYIQNLIGTFDRFKSGQLDLPGFIMSVMNLVATTYWNIIKYIVGLVTKFGGQLLSKAISAGRNFVSGIINQITSLPGKIRAKLMSVVHVITAAIAAWITNAKNKVNDLIRSITAPFSGIPDKIRSALGGVVDAITYPFRNAWNTVKPWIDKINDGIKQITNLGGPRGGDAYGGDLPVVSSSSASSYVVYDDSPIEVNNNVTLDLRNVPAHIDTNTLISMLTEPNVLKALTGNSDFQAYDARIKERLNLRTNRARGV